MKKAVIIAEKELKSLTHEKTLLLAILIQLFIASFSAFLVVGLLSYVSPDALQGMNLQKVKIGIVADDPDHEFVDFFLEGSSAQLIYYPEFAEAAKDFYQGKIIGLVSIPSYEAESDKPIKIDVYLPKGDIRATLVTTALKRPLEEYESYTRGVRAGRLSEGDYKSVLAYRFETRRPRRTSSYFEFIYGALIPLLVLAPAFISGGLVIDLITEESERGTLALLLASPVRHFDVIMGKVMVATLISPAQAGAWLILLTMNFIIIYNPDVIIIFQTIVTFLLVLVAAILAITLKSRGVTHFYYSLVLFLLFFASWEFQGIFPLGMITRFAMGVFGQGEAVIFGMYLAACGVLLYILKKRIQIT